HIHTCTNAAPSHFSTPALHVSLPMIKNSSCPSPSTSPATNRSRPRDQCCAPPPWIGLGTSQTGTSAAPSHLSTPVQPFWLLAIKNSSCPSPSTSPATNRSPPPDHCSA